MIDKNRQFWGRLMKWRSECYSRFGAISEIPLATYEEELRQCLNGRTRLLDVGAGAHKPLKSYVEKAGLAYCCLDTDPDGEFNYRSFDDIPANESFDIITANQVIEHMGVDEAFDCVRNIFLKLLPQGLFFATVPNAAHPVRQRDCTHITPWPANDLYSLLRSAGFEVKSLKRYNKYPLTDDPFKRWIVETICQEFRMDWCDSLLIIGEKE